MKIFPSNLQKILNFHYQYIQPPEFLTTQKNHSLQPSRKRV